MLDRPYQTILAQVEGSTLTLTLNRPERRNAIGAPMVNELLYALEDAHAAPEVHCIVLTGAGKAFCAGADFSQMTGGADEATLPPKGSYEDLLRALLRATKPVIARVNGHAMGGGLGLVASCHFAVASLDAKLGTPEINVGLFPFMIYAVLERVMPRRKLLQMMLTGQRLTAEEAAQAGLVNEAVAPEELDASIEALTTLLASKSPLTLRLGLEALRDTQDMTLDEKLPVLQTRLMQALATDDAREGLMAFLEKRKPEWTGR